MTRNNKISKDDGESWYAMSANRLVPSLGAVKGTVNCDVCVVGAGFTGLSAAVELAAKGYDVIVLESGAIANGASGRNGGQILRGFAKSPTDMVKTFGAAQGKFLNDLTLEGLDMIVRRIEKYNIDCDLNFGHLTVASRKKHIPALQDEIRDWARIGHKDLSYLDQRATQDIVRSDLYIGGMFDPRAAHFHPVNYALGLAEAIIRMGGRIHEYCPAISVSADETPRVVTAHGAVQARHVILAGDVNLQNTTQMDDYALNITAYMLATEPVGEKRARNLLTKDIAVAESNFLMNYFRITKDYRVLFGGTCNYNGQHTPNETQKLRERMLKVFPGLKMTGIHYCWGGNLNMTVNRLPHVGKLSPNVYYAHGFGGHGVITANLLGQILAQAVSGTAERFDVFDKIKHRPLPGGAAFKRPLFMLGAAWYQLRDWL